jgi:hypothetical protein
LENAGLAGNSHVPSEAPAAASSGGAGFDRSQADPTILRAEGHGSPVGGDPGFAATTLADEAVAELQRLGQEAAAHIGNLTKRVDPVAGKPDMHWRRNKLQLARNAAADMVERLLAFLDHVAGDPDVEDDDPGDGDPCDTDTARGYGSETDLSSVEQVSQLHLNACENECELGWNENVNQLHLHQGNCYGQDAEMSLASTEQIDQRLAFSGSRTEREVDPFPYDEPRRQGFTEPTSHARAETEAELRKRGLRNRPEGKIVELSLWRR